MPSGSNMIKMLNISSIFKQHGYVSEYYQSVFFTGLTMVSARKYVQSVEFFRNIQKHIFNMLHGIPDEIKESVDSEKSQFSKSLSERVHSDRLLSTKLESSNSVAVEQNLINITKPMLKRMIQKAAKLEILIADCCSQHSQLQEKLDAFKKATILYKIKSLEEFRVQIPPFSYSSLNKSYSESKMLMGQFIQEEDIYTELLKLQPELLDWILSNLNEKVEPIRIAFLKSLEFLLDTLGCSLGSHICKILNSIIKHVNATQKQSKDTTSQGRTTFNQTLKNIYNHFLESFLSVLSSMSNEILLELFHEVLYPTVIDLNFDTSTQGGSENAPGVFATDICIYLLKITDKIINICQGDIQLNNDFNSISLGKKSTFLTSIFEEVTQKNRSGTVHMAVQNLWQSLINHVFSNYAGKDFKNICMWIYDRISVIKDRADEAGDDEFSQLNVIFELIALLAKENRPKYISQIESDRVENNEVGYPYSSEPKRGQRSLIKTQTRNHLDLDLYSLVSPVLFWCDYAVEMESRINIFKPAWKALIELLESLPVDTNNELIPIVLPYFEKIYEFAEKSSPTLSMLKFITLILKPINDHISPYELPTSKPHKRLNTFLLCFILRFVRWVPHNLNEEAFKVLDSLLHTVKFSLKYVHIKAVTLALLDKYTMRSKIHKETMNAFINLLLDQDNYTDIEEYHVTKDNYIQAFIGVIISESGCIQTFTQDANQEKVDFLEKVNLLNMMINDMDDQHVGLFASIIRNMQLQTFL